VVDLHHLLLAGLPAHLCENCEVEFAGRNFVSTSSIRKIAMLATTVGRSLKRKQFCAFLARARFHTSWATSGHSPSEAVVLPGTGNDLAGRMNLGALSAATFPDIFKL